MSFNKVLAVYEATSLTCELEMQAEKELDQANLNGRESWIIISRLHKVAP